MISIPDSLKEAKGPASLFGSDVVSAANIDCFDMLVSEPVSTHELLFVNLIQVQCFDPWFNFLLLCLVFFVCIDCILLCVP